MLQESDFNSVNAYSMRRGSPSSAESSAGVSAGILRPPMSQRPAIKRGANQQIDRIGYASWSAERRGPHGHA
jgi:hypothetical protein